MVLIKQKNERKIGEHSVQKCDLENGDYVYGLILFYMVYVKWFKNVSNWNVLILKRAYFSGLYQLILYNKAILSTVGA